MDGFLQKVIKGDRFSPPKECLLVLNENFKDAINIEWINQKAHYEAIFYQNNIEFIAVFAKSGQLVEYKMFLPENLLPETIKTQLESKGEIMNVVLINQGNCIVYEAIIRDKELSRSLILFSDIGQVIEEKQL